MKKGMMLMAFAALLASAALVFVPAPASAACWYEGMTWDRCNGQTCPGGWCCRICVT